MTKKIAKTTIIILSLVFLSTNCFAEQDSWHTASTTDINQSINSNFSVEQSNTKGKTSAQSKSRSEKQKAAKKGSGSAKKAANQGSKNLKKQASKPKDKADKATSRNVEETINTPRTKDAREAKKGQLQPSKSKRFESKFYHVYPGRIYDSKNAVNSHIDNFLYRRDYKIAVFDAISAWDLGALNTLLKILGATEFKNKMGETPLIYSAKIGNIDAFLLLLNMGANLCAQDKIGRSAYQVAANQKLKDLIKKLRSF